MKSANPIVFMALAIGSLGAGGGLSYWQYGKVQELDKKAGQMRVELGSKVELVEQLRSAQDDLEAASKELTHLESTVSTIEYVPTLLQDLQKTGESCKLKIEGVRPVPKVEKIKKKGAEEEKPVRKAYEDLDVEVKCRGSFGNLMVFLKRLESFPKIVAVRQMQVQPKIAQDGKSLESLSATLVVRVYVFPVAAPTMQNGFKPTNITADGNAGHGEISTSTLSTIPADEHATTPKTGAH